jgi:hypothetical protein
MSFKGRVNRKSRSDRNHVIYSVENSVTGQVYIGLTFVRPKTKSVAKSRMPLKSAKDRFTSHKYRSENGSTTTFHQNIKRYGPDTFKVSVVEIVRGKKQAHLREIELIESLKPTLNM